MSHVIEQSNAAYEQRDKAQLEIASIAQINRKEQEQFEQQMSELGKVLENEIKAAADRRKQLPSDGASVCEDSKIADRKAAKALAITKEKQSTAQKKSRANSEI